MSVNKTKPRANRMDAFIGHRILQARQDKDWSQRDLGVAVGLSFQQIRKYELGENRVSASTLYKIAQVLNCPLLSFFPQDREAHHG